jgi:hypothetical protein
MGRFGNNKRKVVFQGVVYNSIVEASKSTLIPTSTISSALLRKSGIWCYYRDTLIDEEFFIEHPVLDIEVSSHGRVKRRNGAITAGSLRADGYRYFHHYRSKRNFAVHRLVAETFHENPEDKPIVNHIDEDKQNNCFENLSWVSQRENVRHSMK